MQQILMMMLVVEPDYLLDTEVLFFQSCLYPMKYLHPRSMYTLPRKGVQRGGYPLCGVRGGDPPGWGVWGQVGSQRGFKGSVPRWGFGGKAPEAKIAL